MIVKRKQSPSKRRRLRYWSALGLTDGGELAELGAAAKFTRLFVVLALSQFFLQTAALEQFLEATHGGRNRLSIVNSHPQRHKLYLLFYAPNERNIGPVSGLCLFYCMNFIGI